MTIGRVARRAGIQPSAIRYYEAQGILRPAARLASGYRVYGDDAVKLLLFIKRSQALGITLKELKPLLQLATQGQPPCAHVKQLARRHLREVDHRISELRTLRKQLSKLLGQRPVRPHADEVCPMIERSTATLR